MTAADVLNVCKARGVELTAADGRLRFRAPVGAVDAGLRAELATHKAGLVMLLTAACPQCGRPTDDRRRCWGCHDRACAGCGRPTGSAFIQLCAPCGLTSRDDASG